MRKKRMLTRQQKVIRSYWPYMLGLCEGLFLDIANLNPKRRDPKQCERFRSKWSGKFREWLESEDEALLMLRNMVHDALKHRDPDKNEALALRLANLPAMPGRTNTHLDLPYLDTGDPTYLFPRLAKKTFMVRLTGLLGRPVVSHRKFPILFDMPKALAAAILSFTEKGLRLVRCAYCERCSIGRSNQKFCPGGVCRRSWHEQQPANREKRREYMKMKMREYRDNEKRRNEYNKKRMREKRAKAT